MMNYFTGVFVISVLAFAQAAYYDDYDYCRLPCNYGLGDKTHVVCERGNDCSIDSRNCPDYEIVEMTDKLKQFILDEHNKFRNYIANGLEKRGLRGPQPKAANMMALKYSDELGFIAQCWANTCQPSTHSSCNRGKKLPYGGQNLASRYSTAKNVDPTIERSVKRMISSWYDEVKIFSDRDIKPYRFTSGTGHYTLMVWGQIQQVGCGIIKFRNGVWNTVSMVCNYASSVLAGNVINTEMYKIGEPCTACPRGTTCNTRYNGLCGADSLDLTDRNITSKTNFIVSSQNDKKKERNKERNFLYYFI